jgi:hypothetical protein
VDEHWPVEGTPTSFYARHKAEVERRLDRFGRIIRTGALSGSARA